MELTHKELILKELYFSGYFNTEILKNLFEKNVSISGTSLKNRLYELEKEGKIKRYMVEGHKELFNELVKAEKSGQMSLI